MQDKQKPLNMQLQDASKIQDVYNEMVSTIFNKHGKDQIKFGGENASTGLANALCATLGIMISQSSVATRPKLLKWVVEQIIQDVEGVAGFKTAKEIIEKAQASAGKL